MRLPLWAFLGHCLWTLVVVSEVQKLGPDGKEHVSVTIKSEREGNPAICHYVDEPGGHYAKYWQILYDFTYMQNLKKWTPQNQGVERWLLGAGGYREMSVKGYKPSYRKSKFWGANVQPSDYSK